MSIEWRDVEELVGHVNGMSEDEIEDMVNNDGVDDILMERYGVVDFDTYLEIVEDLLPFTPIIKTAMGGKLAHAFVKGNVAIVKEEIEDN